MLIMAGIYITGFAGGAFLNCMIFLLYAVLATEEVTLPPLTEHRTRVPRAIMTLLIGISLAVGWGLAYLFRQRNVSPLPNAKLRVTHLAAPANTIFAFHNGFSLSPDGQKLIFSARTADGRRQLWERRLDAPSK